MDIKNRITKYCDLQNHDSLSGFDNHASQQNHNVYEAFYNFLNDVKPKRILEIGTALGGFTMFLNIVSKESNLDINIRSYDIITLSWYDEIKNSGIDLRIENIFTPGYQDVDDEVKSFIQSEGTTLVLCDGGYKIGEFNILSNYLKEGDIIMAHDYAENPEIFEKEINGKVWNWLEIEYSNIKNACEKNNLQSYYQDVFSNVAWVCKIKK